MTRALFLPSYDSNPYQAELAQGLRDQGIEVTRGAEYKFLPMLEAYHEDGPPDILHVHWVSSLVDTRFRPLTVVLVVRLLIELTITRLLGVDVVWTAHNRFEHEQSVPTVERFYRHVLCRYASAIIVHGESAREELISAYGLPDHVSDRIVVVPHGNYVESYENELSRSEARDRLDLPAESTVFLHIGNIRPYKNVPELVETFGTLDRTDERLLVVGIGPEDDENRRQLRRQCARKDGVECTFKFVPEDELQLYLSAADVVALPFQDVLTSGSVVLAMSFGRPVVAPRIGCIPETVGDCDDLLYDPDDPDGLENALRKASAADTDELGDLAATRAAELDWESIAERTATVYEYAQDTPVSAVTTRMDECEQV